ncbi:hypothetical protein [Mycolicibacter algericus]|nr:hypothetical protein [Mycolicibacter algericus]
MGSGNGGDNCELWSGFDISGVASNYQAIAGILAGFTFAAVTVVLDRSHRKHAGGHPVDVRGAEYEKLTGIALVAAFLGLLFASFQYGILAGERGCALTGGRAASEELLGDVMFAASISILVYGLVQFAASSSAALAKHARFIVVVLVPPVVFAFAEIKLMDLAISLGSPEDRQPLQPLWDHANRLAAPLGLTVMAVSGALWFAGAKRRRSPSPRGRIVRTSQTALPYITIAFVMYARIRSVVALPTIDPHSHITPGEGWMWVTLLTVVVLLQSTALSFQSGVEISDPVAEKQPA